MNVFDEGFVNAKEFISMAHAIQKALIQLEVTAHNPVQGEAMHKVIAYCALDALEYVDIDGDDKTVFKIKENL